PYAAAAITAAAFDRRCPGCIEALDLFVEAYGAQAGNLALRSVATGGVFIGGGIAPKILPALTSGAFMRAFRSKSPLEHLLASLPAVRGDRLFFTENDGSQNQAVLYLQRISATSDQPPATSHQSPVTTADRQVLVDPNALDADGTTAITVFEPDDHGDRVVYG